MNLWWHAITCHDVVNLIQRAISTIRSCTRKKRDARNNSWTHKCVVSNDLNSWLGAQLSESQYTLTISALHRSVVSVTYLSCLVCKLIHFGHHIRITFFCAWLTYHEHFTTFLDSYNHQKMISNIEIMSFPQVLSGKLVGNIKTYFWLSLN